MCFYLIGVWSTVVRRVSEEFRQRVPSPASHDQPRRERRAPEIQMHLLRQSVQIQASPQGKDDG